MSNQAAQMLPIETRHHGLVMLDLVQPNLPDYITFVQVVCCETLSRQEKLDNRGRAPPWRLPQVTPVRHVPSVLYLPKLKKSA